MKNTYCDIVSCPNAPPGGSFCESGTCREREEWDRIKLPDQLRETVKEEGTKSEA